MNETAAINIFFGIEHIPQKILHVSDLGSLTKDFLVPLAAVALGAYLTHLAYEKQRIATKNHFEMEKCVECLVALNDQLDQIIGILDFMDGYIFNETTVIPNDLELHQTAFFSKSKICFLFQSAPELYLKIAGCFSEYSQAIAQVNKYQNTDNGLLRLGIILTILSVFKSILNGHREAFNALKSFVNSTYSDNVNFLDLNEKNIQEKLEYVNKMHILMLMTKDGITD